MTTTTPNSSCSCSSNSSYRYADTLTEIPAPPVFYEKYIQKRRPVVLKACYHQVTPKLAKAISSSSSSLDHLVTIVGHDTMIQVNEYCNDDSNSTAANNNNNINNCCTTISFSPRHSRIMEMKFGNFVEKLTKARQQKTNNNNNSKSQNCQYYYMTTQNLGVNEEGQPCLYTSPITELIQSGNMDSLRPALLGNLVPMTYNLWIGGGGHRTSSNSSSTNTSSSSSSGLHHDYHDNLYCLLEGIKEFRIAPPHSIHELKMKGTLHTLHANGRIVYKEQVEEQGGGGVGMMIRPDGALEKVERIMEVELRKQDIEERIEALQEDDHDDEQRKLLEQELDAVDEELLDLEMDNKINNDKMKEHEDNHGSDDGDDDAAAGDTVVFGTHYTSDSSSDYCEPDPKRSKKLNSSNHDDHDTDDDAKNDDDDDDDDQDNEEEEDDDGVIPLNFVLEESDKVEFQTLEIKKGDLLYLPAGWFHEVFSKGGNDNDNDNNGIHIAFNYWMHPPDVVDEDTPTGEKTSTTTRTTPAISFDKPYKSQFWQRDWDSRGAETKMPS